MEIEAQIREFVAQNILFSEVGFPLQNDSSFLQEGVVDSLGIVELVSFANREFGIEIIPSEVTPANFDSVDLLAAFIRRKRALVEGGTCVSA